MTLLASEKRTATIDQTLGLDIGDAATLELATDSHESLKEVIVTQLDELLEDTYRGRRAGFTQHVGATTHEFDMCAMRIEGGGPIEELITRHQQFRSLHSAPKTQYEVEIFSEAMVKLRIILSTDGPIRLSEYNDYGKQSEVYDQDVIEMVLFELAHRISDSKSRVGQRSGLEQQVAVADALAKLIAVVPRVSWRGTRTE